LQAALRLRRIEVRRASTATDALAMAQGFGPDIVMLHWHGLDVEGPKLLRMLLDEKLSARPLLLVHAGHRALGADDAVQALQAGADLTLPGAATGPQIDAALAVANRRKSGAQKSREKLRRVMARLEDLQEKFDTIDGDLAEAKKLQQGLLRERFVEAGSAQLSLILRSSGHVGGDLVGHFPINDDVFGFFALDVSGHGVASALMTARLAGYLSATNARQNLAIRMEGDAPKPRAPAAAIADLNMLVMEDLETDHYFTMVLGHMAVETGKVVFSQAGHPHPILQNARGDIAFLPVGGLPVGLIPGAEYEDSEIVLGPGERLMILSDGFTEATLPNGQFLGDDGLVRLLNASRDQAGRKLLETLVWDLSENMGEVEFQDDLSGVLLEFAPQP
ncbi:MAG: SpoIIE family protein phosphatase, partial [Pseudomonadota bacterium]